MTDMTKGRQAPAHGVAPAGYRLPAATSLGRVWLQVGDLERSLGWYAGVLGLHVLERDEASAALGAAGAETPLVELRERRGASAVPRRGRLGLYHFAILLPDRASLGRFAAHVVGQGVQLGASDHLVSEALYLYDPDGLGIEVYADRPREEWRVAAGQVVMATDPLDLRALIEGAGGTAWEGVPSGAVMGHVHLHVGELRGAEAFYHEGLGLDKVVWSYPGALFLSAGGYHHHLGLNTWAPGALPATDGDARLLEWEIVVPAEPDARAAAENLVAAGHAEEAASSRVFRDPWGTAVKISSPADRRRIRPA